MGVGEMESGENWRAEKIGELRKNGCGEHWEWRTLESWENWRAENIGELRTLGEPRELEGR